MIKKATILLFALFALVSCNSGSSSKGVKFNPQERKTSMSDSEREELLNKKRLESGTDFVEYMLGVPAIKLNLMPPKPNDEISQRLSDMVTMKMLPILTQNGISGLAGHPTFALCVTMAKKESKLTSSVPQKFISSYEMNMYIANLSASEVYASYSMTITGAGESLESSAINALDDIKNSPELQLFLKQGKDKIINWFEHNFSDFKRAVEKYIIEDKYDLAYSLLQSVPIDATECYKYVQENHERIAIGYREHIANDQFTCMKNAIASSNSDKYDPSVGAYLKMIPNTSPIKAKAEKIFDDYISRINANTKRAREHDFYMAESEARYKILQMENEIKANEALAAQAEADKASVDAGSSFLSQVLSGVISSVAIKLLGF